MAGTLVAVFEDHREAVEAAKKLVENGVVMNDISLVCKDAGGAMGASDYDMDKPDDEVQDDAFITHGFREVAMHDVEQPLDPAEERAPRMVTGVVAGAPLGALLVANSIMIPGMADVIAAGPLAMMIGTVGGGIIGGIIGALTSGGIPVNDAQRYHDRVVAGDTLVAVLVGHHDLAKIENIFKQQGGSDVHYFSRFIDSFQSVES